MQGPRGAGAGEPPSVRRPVPDRNRRQVMFPLLCPEPAHEAAEMAVFLVTMLAALLQVLWSLRA